MKRYKISLLIFWVFAFIISSCERILDMEIDLYSDEIEAEFIISTNEVTGYQIFAEGKINADFDSLISENGYSSDDVESITITSFKLEVLNGDETINLNKFSLLEASISTTNLEDSRIAYQDSIPLDSRTLSLESAGVEFKDYLDEGDYTLHLKGTNVEPIDKTIILKSKMKFKIIITLGDAIK